ncbi:hypothetical protein CK203_060685 [Vitis vinifera]|uniref:Uncharacterized protein n=1 Tax=Vitis vinifera TaxID=29760 RepID=A0A438GA56_VITVI|nr:hypothetical protein CK203_060685 [Vitis vinifera]
MLSSIVGMESCNLLWQHDVRAQHFYLFARNNSIRKKKDQKSLGDLDEGLPEPSDLLATLPPWKKREILPLFNGEETQEAVKEEPPKLILKPLPTELKYAYLEKQAEPCCYFFISYHYSGGLST